VLLTAGNFHGTAQPGLPVTSNTSVNSSMADKAILTASEVALVKNGDGCL
jgi:hypothetical protein